MSNASIKQDLLVILKEIQTNQKESATSINKLQQDINNKHLELKEDIAEIKQDIAVIKERQENNKKDISEIKGSQKAQLWSLIAILAVAILSLAASIIKTTFYH